MKRALILAITLLMVLSFSCCDKNSNEETTLEMITEQNITLPEATEPPPEVDRMGEEIYKNHTELTPVDYDNPAILPKSDDMGQEYVDKLTFICDSPTYWMWPWGLLKDGEDTNCIWTGPEGTMTLNYQSSYEILDPYDNTRKTIRQTVEEHKPEYLIIAVGINGVALLDEEGFKAEYRDLVSDIMEISPDTKLMCQAIYPITPDYWGWGDITNETITRANSWILQVAGEEGCRYIDAFAPLLGEDGNAIPELMGSDGLHPNKEGLTKVLEYIRTHAWVDTVNYG